MNWTVVLVGVVSGGISAFAMYGTPGSESRAADLPARVIRPVKPSEMEIRDRLTLARQANLKRLHEYWTHGVFVQNPDPMGDRGHFILDGANRPCPLASVIIESGQRTLVERLARENNGVKVEDTKSGPLFDWILNSGLTQEECVLIQQPSRSGAEKPGSIAKAGNPKVKPAKRIVAQPVAATAKAAVTDQVVLKRDLEVIEHTLRAQTDESLDLAVKRLLATL